MSMLLPWHLQNMEDPREKGYLSPSLSLSLSLSVHGTSCYIAGEAGTSSMEISQVWNIRFRNSKSE